MPRAMINLDVTSQWYPPRLRDKGLSERYPSLAVAGDARLLDQPLLGLLCSMRCPGRVILAAYELARSLRGAAVAVVGGFHSPMEKECLDLLLRGAQPVVICPARSIGPMRIPPPWVEGIKAGRVLVVSPFDEPARRVTSDLAARRNQFVAALAQEVMVLHANPGGRIEGLCHELATAGAPVWTLDLPENAAALQAGALPTTLERFAPEWRTRNPSPNPAIANIPPSTLC